MRKHGGEGPFGRIPSVCVWVCAVWQIVRDHDIPYTIIINSIRQEELYMCVINGMYLLKSIKCVMLIHPDSRSYSQRVATPLCIHFLCLFCITISIYIFDSNIPFIICLIWLWFVSWAWNIEVETKWLAFSRQHFQIHFLEWKSINFN